MTFVHSDKDSEASLVLIEARRGGGVGLFLTKPLFIYKDEEHRVYSDDTAFIYENGLFPTDFYKN